MVEVFCIIMMGMLKEVVEAKTKSYDPGGEFDEARDYRDCSKGKVLCWVNHFIHIYSKILGDAKVNWWELLLQIKPQIEKIGKVDIQIYTKRMRNNSKKNIIKVGS
jgi:hypothetical protein